jgi:membrane-bound metal-dependent hydrolase YbcI (DUF457 family)
MMGPGHALMGAIAGLSIGMIADLPVGMIFISSLISAGAALLPDADHSSSTFRYSFGWPGLWITKLLDWFSTLVYAATKTSKDPNRIGGHRTLTHTIIFNVAFGVGIYYAATFTVYIQYLVIFVFSLLGLRSLLSKGIGPFIPFYLPKVRNVVYPRSKIYKARKSRKSILRLSKASAFLLAVFISGLFVVQVAPEFNPILLAIIIGTGSLVHLIGDALTNSGVPLLWPLPISGKVWFRVKAPITFDTGSDIELNIITPILFLIFAGASVVTIYNYI